MTLVPLDVLKLLKADATTTQRNLHAHLADETIDRSLKQVVKRLEKYIAVASQRKIKGVTTDEIEAADGFP